MLASDCNSNAPSFNFQGWRKRVGRIEGTFGQQRCAALLLALSDFRPCAIPDFRKLKTNHWVIMIRSGQEPLKMDSSLFLD